MCRRKGFVLDFCPTFRILSFVTSCKNLRSPFTKQLTGLFYSLRSNPYLYSYEKARKHPQMRMLLAFWRRERDSNPRVLAHKLISSHRALIPFSASTCLFLPNFSPFPPHFSRSSIKIAAKLIEK